MKKKPVKHSPPRQGAGGRRRIDSRPSASWLASRASSIWRKSRPSRAGTIRGDGRVKVGLHTPPRDRFRPSTSLRPPSIGAWRVRRVFVTSPFVGTSTGAVAGRGAFHRRRPVGPQGSGVCIVEAMNS